MKDDVSCHTGQAAAQFLFIGGVYVVSVSDVDRDSEPGVGILGDRQPLGFTDTCPSAGFRCRGSGAIVRELDYQE